MNYIGISPLLLVALTINLYGADDKKDNIDIRITVKDGSNNFIFSTCLQKLTTLHEIYRLCNSKFSPTSDLFLCNVSVSTDKRSLSKLEQEELEAIRSGWGFEFRLKEPTSLKPAEAVETQESCQI